VYKEIKDAILTHWIPPLLQLEGTGTTVVLVVTS